MVFLIGLCLYATASLCKTAKHQTLTYANSYCCSSMDCSPERLRSLVSNGTVEFDADIAGPGVQAAFLITSLIALATLILSFMTHSVPSRLLNSGDAILATVARRTYRHLRAKFPKAKHARIVQSREERTHAFMAFMVAMCDQILVSQASILIASFIIHDSITIYSAKIVIALSFLASTVHLGSLPFYIDRLQGHGTAKLIRVLTVATCSGMLVFLLIVRLSFTWNMATHVYLTCTLHDYRMEENMEENDYFILIMQMFPPLAVLYATYETIRLLYREQPTDGKSNGPAAKRQINFINPRGNAAHSGAREQPVSPTIDLQVLERLEDQATTVNHQDLSDVEIESRAILSILDHISSGGVHSSTGKETEYKHQRSILFKPRSATMRFKEVMREVGESNRQSLLNKWLRFKSLSILTSSITSPRKLRLLVTLAAETWAFHQCRGSFVWRLFWLWSGNVYGIVTIFVSRAVTTGMSGNPNKMGFGQVVPLTLLALPILVAMESHAGNVFFVFPHEIPVCSLTFGLDYKKKLNSIQKARVDEANHESPPGINTRFHSIGQFREHRRDMHLQTDSASIRIVNDMLKKRSRDIGHPELYSWLIGDNLTKSPRLRMGAVAHAVMMFVVTTSLGLFIAYPFYGIEFAMTSIFLLFAARRVVGLILVVFDMRSCPAIIDHLGYKQPVYNTEYGNNGEMSLADGNAGQNFEEDSRQEET